MGHFGTFATFERLDAFAQTATCSSDRDPLVAFRSGATGYSPTDRTVTSETRAQ
jgi:hypothetical protein